MMNKTLIASLITSAALVASNAAFAQQLSLNAISSYLNGLNKAKGQFTQVNPDGTLSKGTFYLHRPGRMRFEYDPPNKSLVVANSGVVAIADQKSNTGPQQFPLSKTPLSIILAKNVNLSQNGMVYKHTSDDVSTSITARDPKRPNIGNIQMVFTSSPTELRQWIVTNEAGQKTTVILGQLDKNANISSSKFDIQSLKLKRDDK